MTKIGRDVLRFAICCFAMSLTLNAGANDNKIYLSHPDAVDGATLRDGKGTKFRVFAIVPPSGSRICTEATAQFACSERAREILELYASSFLTCTNMGAYADIQAVRCRDFQGRDIGARMVRTGWALPDRDIGDQYIFEEIEAEALGQGIWRREISVAH
ncbi:MAG: hypothetical protein AAFR71_02860 [Pseudomonadota bacterium]